MGKKKKTLLKGAFSDQCDMYIWRSKVATSGAGAWLGLVQGRSLLTICKS